MDLRAEVEAAEERIRSHARRTPVELSRPLSAANAGRVHLKLENFQLTGSFKFRGAMNKLLALDEEARSHGVVAASTGNHGAAIACGAERLACRAVIFAPEGAMPSKLETIRSFGAEVRLVGEDCIVAEAAAREFSEAEAMPYVSPYNDPHVVGGQGTVGLELHQDLEHLDAVFVAVGGGGLIGGAGGYLKALRPRLRVIACSPSNSAVMHASLEAGEILDLPSKETLSDGTAGGVEAGSITFELCRDVIDDFVLVSEDEIEDGLRTIVGGHHMLVEGAAGAAVAAFQKRAAELEGQSIAIVLCGANIDPAILRDVLSR